MNKIQDWVKILGSQLLQNGFQSMETKALTKANRIGDTKIGFVLLSECKYNEKRDIVSEVKRLES